INEMSLQPELSSSGACQVKQEGIGFSGALQARQQVHQPQLTTIEHLSTSNVYSCLSNPSATLLNTTATATPPPEHPPPAYSDTIRSAFFITRLESTEADDETSSTDGTASCISSSSGSSISSYRSTTGNDSPSITI